MKTYNIKVRYFFILVLIFSFFTSQASTFHAEDTILPGRMLSFKDSLFLGVKAPKKIYVYHIMQPKQNLKGLESYYSISVGDLAYYNPELSNVNSIPVGFPVKIPIPINQVYLKDNAITAVRWKVIPLMYQVKPGETLFRIAKVYFGMDVETLKARNGLESNVLEKGQILLIGWMSAKGIPQNARKYSGLGGELRGINDNLRKKFVAGSRTKSGKKKKAIKERGIASWSKGSSRDTKLYALHRTAPIGTILKVYAPAAKRTLFVKVIGKLSNNVHKSDVILYLSPSAAKALGAVNDRLRVQLTHY